MTMLEQFQNKVLNTNGCFKLNDEDNYSSFMRCTNGNAEYIYGDFQYYNDDFSNIERKYELTAIVDRTTKMIYIVDVCPFLKSFKKEEIIYPDGCVNFNNYVKETNKYFQNVLFRKYYDSIEVDINSVTDENFINYQKKQARYFVLSGNEVISPKLNHMFTSNDIAKMICGHMNIEDEANERFANTRELIVKTKLRQELIKKYIEEKSVVKDWEVELTNSINKIEAKFVNVEFNFNGNVGSEKINPKSIIRIMMYNDYFSGFNFATTKGGDKLLKTLGATNEFDKRDTWLTCKHITKITYGRKTLYERKQN